MRIVYLKIQNFRGIKKLKWAPSAGMNCLIGPGDSTKSTVLDAIELCLNPRSYIFADDCDFFNLNIKAPIRITVTLSDLPSHFKARYGLHLRGWDALAERIIDEPGPGFGGRALHHRCYRSDAGSPVVCRPYSDDRFSEIWRVAATDAGIPKKAWNRDLRKSGSTEAPGAPIDDLKKADGPSSRNRGDGGRLRRGEPRGAPSDRSRP